MNVNLFVMCSKVWYIRAVQTDNDNNNNDNGDQMPKKIHRMQSNLRNARVHRYKPGKRVSFPSIYCPRQDKESILGSPCNPRTPFTVSFRQDMACPDDPRLPQTIQIFQTRSENIDLSFEWHYRVFLAFLWSRCTHNLDVCIICIVTPCLVTHNR